MRYFLVSFTLTDKFSLGSISFAYNKFFSKEYLLEIIKENAPEVIDICIINIFEFQNQIDYENYENK